RSRDVAEHNQPAGPPGGIAADQAECVPPGSTGQAHCGPHVRTPASGPASLSAGAPPRERKRGPAPERPDRDPFRIGELSEIFARQALGAGSQIRLQRAVVSLVIAIGVLQLLGTGILALAEVGRMLLCCPRRSGQQVLSRPVWQAAETRKVRFAVRTGAI